MFRSIFDIIFLVSLLLSCEDPELRAQQNRPLEGGDDLPSYIAEETVAVKAGEGVVIEIEQTVVTIEENTLNHAADVRIRVLSALPERDEIDGLGASKGDIVEVVFSDRESKTIFGSELLSKPYKLGQALEGVENFKDLNYVVTTSPGTSDEDFSVINSKGISSSDASLSLLTTRVIVELQVTHALVHAIENPNIGTNITVVDSGGQIENVGGTVVSTNSNYEGPAVPKNMASGFSVTDTDTDSGLLGGGLTITKAIDESDLTHYVVYWGRSASQKMDGISPVTTLPKTGNDIGIPIGPGLEVPIGASYLLVFSKNDSGEMNKGLAAAVDELDPATMILSLDANLGAGIAPQVVGSGVWVDLSSNSNDGAIAGAAWTGTGKGPKNSYALDFDGASDFVEIADSDELSLTLPLTISAWIKLDALPSSANKEEAIVSKWSEVGNEREWRLYIAKNDFLVFEKSSDGSSGTIEVVSADSAFGAENINKWMHVALTINGTGVVHFYKNKDVLGVGSISDMEFNSGNASVLVGAIGGAGDSASWFLDGSIGQMEIYESSSSIVENYESTFGRYKKVLMQPFWFVSHWSYDPLDDASDQMPEGWSLIAKFSCGGAPWLFNLHAGPAGNFHPDWSGLTGRSLYSNYGAGDSGDNGYANVQEAYDSRFHCLEL